MNAWAVRRDPKKWPLKLKRGGRCREVAVSGGSTVVVLLLADNGVTLLIFSTE